MLQSNSTYITPIGKKGITARFQEKRIDSFLGKPSNPYPKSNIKKVTIRIGDTIFRTISGSSIEKQSEIYIRRVQRLGVLLGGEKSLHGFAQFLRGK